MKAPVRKQRGQAAHELICYTFHEDFTFEAYVFQRNENNDGFTWGVQQFCNGVENYQSPELQAANFTRCVYRRVPRSADGNMTGERGYWRVVIIRYPPENETTPESRQEGLRILKQFLLNPQYSDYPPRDITTRDATDPENIPSLDDFFLDNDIKELMEEDIDAINLNEHFYQNFPEFAEKCWAGPHVSQWARGLGFP